MSSTSQALKRLGVGTVTVATVLAMPYVGVASAFAATPTDPVITITSQLTGNGSPRNDGTDTTVKLTANVAYTPSATASDNTNAPSSVQFAYVPTNGTAVNIGVPDAAAPYSVNWTPPAGGGAFTVQATVLNSSGKPDNATPANATDSKPITVTDSPSVHIAAPAEGGSEGYFVSTTAGTATNTIEVSGTRSAGLPQIDLYTQLRDNATGLLTAPAPAVDGTPQGTVNAGDTMNGGTAAWSTTATIPTPSNPNEDVLVTAVARDASGGTVGSDELTEAKLYAQTQSKITVAPTTATFPVGAAQKYAATVVDQNGAPIGGLKVLASASDKSISSGACNTTVQGTISQSDSFFCFFGAQTASSTTDVQGNAPFTVKSKTAQTQTITFQTASDTSAGFKTANGDLQTSAQAITYLATSKNATLVAVPAKALYATDATPTNGGTSGEYEYDGTTPVLNFCATDQNGNPLPNTGTPTVTDTRSSTVKATGVTTPDSPVLSASTIGAANNCYKIQPIAATGNYGSDVITAYFNNDGQAGFQPGGSDVGAVITLKWADLSITALDTQSQVNTATTVSFKVLGADGSPFAGRKVTLTATKTVTGGFTATQPAGTSAPNTAGNTVIATTDSNGIASATVNSSAAGAVAVTATDNVPTTAAVGAAQASDQVPTNEAGTSTVDFRAKSVAATTLTQSGAAVIVPAGSPQTTSTPSKPRPGDVKQVTYTVKDANGGILANVPVALSLNHGFFTPDCPTTPNTEQYANCTFSPDKADGAVAGNLKNLGSTETLTTNGSGTVTFSEAVARDAALDVNGSVDSIVTAVANGGTVTSTVGTFTTAGQNPINGSAVKLVPVPSTDMLSGDRQTVKQVTFAVHVIDQFGNLVQLPAASKVDLTVTGGTLSNSSAPDTSATAQGSYTGGERVHTLSSSTTSTTGTPATVTATYSAPVTNFKSTAAAVFSTVTGTTVQKTDSFTINFYAIDQANLSYTFASTPGNTVPVNTTVSTSVTIKDQKGAPVADLAVLFLRSGPDNQNNSTDSLRFKSTNTVGKAGYSFSSSSPGTATVTVIVSDNSGNELSRGVQNVTFTAGIPTPSPTTPRFTIAKNPIITGGTTTLTVTGTAGDKVQVLARTFPATTYHVTITLTLDGTGTAKLPIAYSRNTSLFVRNAKGSAAPQSLVVVSIVSLNVKALGAQGVFYGHVTPAVSGRAIKIYYRLASGTNFYLVASGVTNSTGDYRITHTFRANSKIVAYALRVTDGYNSGNKSAQRALTLGG